MSIPIDMRQVVHLIATAVDLVGVKDVLHGRRVAIIAVECAKEAGWDRSEQNLLFNAGLLHDIGVSSTRVHRNILDELDWTNAKMHCDQGSHLLESSPHLAHLAPIVQHHHTHWEELQSLGIQPSLALQSNMLFLADRIDSVAAPYYSDHSLLLHAEEISSHIDSLRGSFFAPQLVDGFLGAARREAFWLVLTPEFIQQYVTEIQSHTDPQEVGLRDIKTFALIIAQIVDAKSHFTSEHSLGVARLTQLIAEHFGIDAERQGLLEIAALMHDIGKLQIPDEILESTEKYSRLERAIMKKHSFATRQILKQVCGFEEIACWASQHHESLNGNGYPFHLRDDELPLESRIIKVADIYQALAQDRPYRKALPAAEILTHLRKMQGEKEVDRTLVKFVAQNLDSCHHAAVGS